MEELEDIIRDTDERGAAIARLLKLIEMDSEIINRHRQAGESGSYVHQYEELCERNLKTLSNLIRESGYVDGELHLVDNAA